MDYEIWDKKSDIKGQNAEYWFNNNPEFKNGDVVLFKNESGIVERVESVETLRTNNNLNSSLSSIEVIEEYILIRQLEEEKSNQETLSLEEATNKISTLQAENKKLNEVNQEQDQLLVDNAYKITMLEMNLGGM